MSNESIVLTDPARELAELASQLCVSTTQTGESFLSASFGVAAWSPDFFNIIFTIVERCQVLSKIIETLDIDSDYRDELIGHVETIASAFNATAMRNQWGADGLYKVGALNTGPLKAISGLVRQSVAYKKLGPEEIESVKSQVSELLGWLRGHQLHEHDFIRQAIIEGLERFEFRLDRLRWLGWGYTLDSLREVVAAYLLLEHASGDLQKNPDAGAVLQKVKSTVQSIYQKIAVAKDVTDGADWLIRAYGWGSLVYQGGKPLVAGLLT